MRYRREAGFTIIELVVVIIVLAIIAIAVFSRWPSGSINLGAQAKALVSDIRYAQNLSVTSGQRYYLRISPPATYTISNYAGSGLTTYTLSSGMTFGTLTNLPNSLVAFDGQGTPYTNLTMPGAALAATATIQLKAQDGSSTNVTITPGTGLVGP